MTSQDWKRLGMHFPIGAIARLVQLSDPISGLTILGLTVTYEAFNDWRKMDKSYKDVLGIVWGYGMTACLIALLGVVL